MNELENGRESGPNDLVERKLYYTFMNACEVGHIGVCAARSVSRECLGLVFTKKINHP